MAPRKLVNPVVLIRMRRYTSLACRRNWRSAVPHIVVPGILLLMLGVCDRVAAEPVRAAPNLFLPGLPAEGEHPVELADPTVVRSRAAHVDFGLLGSPACTNGHVIRFNLFDGLSLDAIVEMTIRRSPVSYTCIGRLVNDRTGSFSLAVEQDVMIGNIRPAGNLMYQIRFLGVGQHEIREVDQRMYPRCGVGPQHEVGLRRPPGAEDVGKKAAHPPRDSGALFDVLVVYTAEARDAIGGTTAMNALINLIIDETNTAYANSLITPRVNLAHRAEIEYTESGDFDTDLDALRGTSDGSMDDVHALRDAHGADLVCLLVADDSVCGIAVSVRPRPHRRSIFAGTRIVRGYASAGT